MYCFRQFLVDTTLFEFMTLYSLKENNCHKTMDYFSFNFQFLSQEVYSAKEMCD